MKTLQTQRTLLRRFQFSDLGNMIRLESDPEVMKFTSYRVPQTSENTEARLKSLIENEAAMSPLGVWAVELKKTAEFVGWFMLKKTESDLPELGFMLAKNQWGKGFATEVSQTLIDYAMKDLGHLGLVAVTDRGNSASIHVLEKLGFRKISSRTQTDKVLKSEVQTHIFEIR